MKKLTFVIIGGNPGEHAKDLIEEISLRGHVAIPVKMKSIVFSIDEKGFRARYHEFDLIKGDVFLFRGGYRTVKPAVSALANYLLKKNKVIINEDLGVAGFFGDKVFQAQCLTQYNIPHPKTIQSLSFTDIPYALDQLVFPVIAKPIFGSKGHGIMKFESQKSALVFLKKHNRDYFLQEYIPIDGDLRIFVVGGKAIAGMKRYILPKDFRSNASLGAFCEPIVITPPIEKLACLAAQAMNYEIAGVDIIEKDEKFLVLEVNSAPQWKKLKEVTGINPAQAIVNYALQKFKNKVI